MQAENAQDQPKAACPSPTRVRYLTPETCRIHRGVHGALHVTLESGETFGGAYMAYAFPVEYPKEFIALLHTGEGECEIGIIRDLDTFGDDQVHLIREALARRYFIHTITNINRIGWKYGFVTLEVETDKGNVEVLMRWKQHRAVDYGRHGKVLIDVNDNHFLIPDVTALPPRQQRDFTRIIYW